MSGELYAKPGTATKVYFEPDDKESMVNIYVSAESLRVHDSPWVEVMSPNTPGPAETQHPGTVHDDHVGLQTQQILFAYNQFVNGMFVYMWYSSVILNSL